MGGPTKPKKRRDRRRAASSPVADPRSYPVTTLSPNTYEGRIQAFGNVLRAAKYGSGGRQRVGQVLIGLVVVLLVLLVISSLVSAL
jgi:hypothetical protein